MRLALTSIAVVLGVSFMAGTLMLTDTMNAAVLRLFTQTAQGRDTTVRAKSGYQPSGLAAVQRAPVPESLITSIRRDRQVAAVEGTVEGYAQVIGKDGKAISVQGGPTVGTNWTSDVRLSIFRRVAGHPPSNGDQVALDEGTLRRGGFTLGDEVTILTTRPPRAYTIVASVVFGRAAGDGTTLAIFDGPTAQALFGQVGGWTEVEVAGIRPGITAAGLTQRLNEALPPGYEAVSTSSVAAALAKAVENGLGRITAFLLVFAAVSTLVGGFIIYNTFSILVAQRSRELALLRAVGASRRQINSSVLLEAVSVGLLASAVGLVAGAVFARGMERVIIASGFGLPSATLHVSASTIVRSFLLGNLVTVASSIIPARRAARVPPVAAMADLGRAEPPSPRRSGLVGVASGGGGLMLLISGLVPGFPKSTLVVGLAATIVFASVVVLSPWAVAPMVRLVGWPLGQMGGMSGRLSRRNVVRNPQRTAASAAALMVGVALVTVVATVGATMRATLSRLIDDSGQADYVISSRSGNLFSAARLNGFSPEVAQGLKTRPELAVVASVRSGPWHSPSATNYLTAVDPLTAPAVIRFRMTSGSVARLSDGAVLIDTSVAKRRHLKVGDWLVMGFDATGNQSLRVGGTYQANEFVENYVISDATFSQNYPNAALDQQLFIRDRSSSAAALAAVKQVISPYPNLQILDQRGVKAEEQRRLDTVLNLGYVLLAFSILIALIGIVNTLSLAVIERTRELGLLRAVGMRPVEIRRMVRWESILVSLMGGLVGIVLGVGLGLPLVIAISFPGTKVVSLPLATLASMVALSAVVGVISAVLPARRAANIDVLTAIAVP